MSEQAIGDEPRRSGYREYEAKTTTTLLNSWFRSVAEVIPHETHKYLHSGQFADIHTVPGVGKIIARYDGSTPHEHIDPDDPHEPLCDYLLRLYMVAEDVDVRDPQATGTGWHMQFAQSYRGALSPATPAAAEELIGSTSEQRTELEGILRKLHDSYVSSRQADIVPVPEFEPAEVVRLFADS